MSLLVWSNTFSVGVKEIDDQHKKLIEIANQLSDAIKAGYDREIVERIVAELADYTHYHFALEERLMDTHGYPNADLHKRDHQEIIKTVDKFKNAFDHDPAPTGALMTFLRDWLSRHIMNSDRALTRDLNQKGIK